MRNTHRLAAALTALLLASSTFADISPPRQFGQSLAPGEATKVAMTSEVVTVTLLPEKALVRAVFHLDNTGAAENLLVGFPDTAPGTFYGTLSGAPEGVGVRLRDFRARVDGVEVAHRTCLPEEDDGVLDDAGPRPEHEPAEGWITWDMTFPAAGKTTIEVDYWVPYRPRYASTLLGHRDFTYVLVTGAAWHGPIGKAELVVRWGEGVTREHVSDIRFPGFEESEAELVWKLTDLVPEEDLRLSVRRFANYEEAGRFYLESAKRFMEKGDDAAVARCRAAAADCLWRTESYRPCLAACRAVIAFELAVRNGQFPHLGRRPDLFRVSRAYRAPPEVWERWVVRCLAKLDRIGEARAAAPAAIAAMRADLDHRKRYRHEHLEELEARIARYETFAAGGLFED